MRRLINHRVGLALVAAIAVAGAARADTCIWTGSWDVTPDSADDVIIIRSGGDLSWSTPATVTSWTQEDTYTDTVTIETVYGSSGFTQLTISGDCVISNGTWTHQDNSTAESYRLKVSVGGNLTLESGASINADSVGYDRNYGPGKGSWSPAGGGTYGGRAAWAGRDTYGSITEPVNLGSGGGRADTDLGGGAVYLAVDGLTTLDGDITAKSPSSTAPGSGGSIFLKTGTLGGSGALDASAAQSNGGGGGSAGAGGGRVAVVLTNGSSFGSVSMVANGNSSSTLAAKRGGAGTIYLQTAAQSTGEGKLIIDNAGTWGKDKAWTSMDSSAFDYSQLAEIEIKGKANLAIDADDTFDLSSVNLTGAGSANSFLTLTDLSGVTLPSNLVIPNYTLLADALTNFTGNVTVQNGGALSHVNHSGALDMTITGNLTIDAGGKIDVNYRGYNSGSPSGSESAWSSRGASHGGRGGGSPLGSTYGSVLAPIARGAHGTHGDDDVFGGGGRVKLAVSGTTTLNGTITAKGGCTSRGAAGGSVYLTTDTLGGSGAINVDGKDASPGGGGGRIAVVLTGSDSLGSVTMSAIGDGGTGDGSAGTIYTETQSEGSGGGTIVVNNDHTTGTDVSMLLPATYDPSEDLSGAALHVEASGKVAFTTNVNLREIVVASSAALQLGGCICTTEVLNVSGTAYGFGSYTTSELPSPVSGVGTIVVAGVALEIRGNGHPIADGDATPAVDDDTDYGQVLTTGFEERTFAITNTGNLALILTDSPSVALSGPHSGDYSVSAQPGSTNLNPGGSTMFTVRVDPGAIGFRTGVVSIANNSSTNNPYTFAVHAEGVAAAQPEIDVLGLGQSIVDGDTTPDPADDTEFGSIVEDVHTVTHTFTINNTGLADLTLTGTPERVALVGSDASQFTVTVQPSSPVASGSNTTFAIRYEPTSPGAHSNVTVSIPNNDADEAPYDFKINGTARPIDVVWSGAGGDNLASTSNNWVGGVSPVAGQTVVLNATSSKDMTWDGGDNGLTESVGGWVQTVDYAGTVTIATVYGAAGFTNFAITGDCTISNGVWTHVADNDAAQNSRLKASIAGNLVVSSASLIDVDGRGYYQRAGPGGGTWSPSQGASHGGRGQGKGGSGYKDTYGSMTEPAHLGSGGRSGGHGGGAVYLEVGGSATVDGTIRARGEALSGGGSGGSVYLRADTLAGDGSVNASAQNGSPYNGGGRVAVVLDSGSSFGSVTMVAAGSGNDTGAGTVYTETAAQTGGNGKLLVDNQGNRPDYRSSWTVMDTAAFDYTQLSEIEIKGEGNLAVDADDTFDLSSVNLTVSGASVSFLTLDGVDGVTFPATLTVSDYTLCADGLTNLVGDLHVADGGAVSHTRQTASIDLVLTGNLQIDAGGAVDVNYRGGGSIPAGAGTSWSPGRGASHGGQGGTGTTAGSTYGKILTPDRHGADGTHGGGGGAVSLAVSGTTTLNGAITSRGYGSNRGGAGGSIFLTTGSLAGDGAIDAGAQDGGPGGGGGRIAVVLTNSDSFASVAMSALGEGALGDGSAGSIYKQTQSQGSGAGEIIVSNSHASASDEVMLLPASYDPGEDLSGTALSIESYGHAAFTTNLVLRELVVADTASLQLGGFICTTEVLRVSGTTYAYGAYESGDLGTPVTGVGTVVVSGVALEVWGGGQLIADGDTTPSTDDDTDYGQVLTIGSDLSIFTITNTGSVTLELTGSPAVQIGGAHLGDYTVIAGPDLTSLSPGQATTFTVEVEPGAEGFRTGVVSIANNSSTNTPYTFTLRAEGTGGAAPEIGVLGLGQSIVDGDTTPDPIDDTEFGSIVEDVHTVTHTFTINNTGLADLTLTGTPERVALVGSDASQYTVTVQPSSPVAAGSNTTFAIRYQPTSPGAHSNVTVNIPNNDADEAPYDFKINGTARPIDVVWSGAGGDNLASTSNNWVGGVSPVAGQTVVLNATSSKDMTWDGGDNGLTESVGGWVQTVDYAGTVTIATVYGAAGFTNFAITGDCTISNGVWTHAADNDAGQNSRLKASIAGNLVLSSSSLIDVDGRGYYQRGGPGGGNWTPSQGASHGGRGQGKGGSGYKDTYGSMTEPTHLGSGGRSGGHGGGAVYLEVGGSATVDGTIRARGEALSGGGSGGSVYLRADTLAGDGSVNASAQNGVPYNGGGRIAVVLDSGSSFGSVTMVAAGSGNDAGAGTVYTETSAQAGGHGKLMVDNQGNRPDYRSSWTVMDTAAFDYTQLSEIEIKGEGNLAVDADDTFDLSSVNLTVSGASVSFLTLDGVDGVTFPATLTVSDYTLCADGLTNLVGDLHVADGGAVSHTRQTASIDLVLTGNLQIDAGGAVDVNYRGGGSIPAGAGTSWSPGRGASHGGQGGTGTTAGSTYGKILTPDRHGADGTHGGGGGAVALAVSGATTLNGAITSRGYGSNRGGAGGSIFLTTGSLAGDGAIDAGAQDGGPGGGGGRIAVVLTNSDSFASVAMSALGEGALGDGSAGTIYKQTQSQGSAAGEIIVSNSHASASDEVMLLPASYDPAEDLGDATLYVLGYGRVGLTTNVQLEDVFIDINGVLDLNSYTITVDVVEHVLDGATNGPGAILWVIPPSGTMYRFR